MRTPFALAALFVLALAAAGCGDGGGTGPTPTPSAEPTPEAISRIEPHAIPNFTLTDQDGAEFRLADLDGSLKLFYFGYTNCPDICPTTMVDWRDVKRGLGEDAAKVEFVMVTVDPEQDTPPVLKRFLALFDEEFIGLTGDARALSNVWAHFGVKVRRLDLPESATGHSISHSAAVWVVDEQRNLVMKFSFAATPEDMIAGVRQLLEG